MPRPRNNETRQIVLKNAYNRFMTTDYELVLLKEIAKDAGITVTLLQHYFPAKSDLVIHIIYDMLSKNVHFLEEKKAIIEEIGNVEEEGYAIMLSIFYYMFNALSRNNERMLKAYSHVICDTKLMNNVVDFCNDNFNIPETVDTIQKRYGQFVFWGSMSQIVALTLKKRLPMSIKDAIRQQYRYFLLSIGKPEERIDLIFKIADKVSSEENCDDFYNQYIKSMDHFINCNW